jgi:hypothetical protein
MESELPKASDVFAPATSTPKMSANRTTADNKTGNFIFLVCDVFCMVSRFQISMKPRHLSLNRTSASKPHFDRFKAHL